MFLGYIATNMLLHHIRRTAMVSPARSARVFCFKVVFPLSITDSMCFLLTNVSAESGPSVCSSDSNSASSVTRSSLKVHYTTIVLITCSHFKSVFSQCFNDFNCSAFAFETETVEFQ